MDMEKQVARTLDEAGASGSRRESFRKAGIEATTLGVGGLLVLALFGMVNYYSHRHYKRFDWTSSQVYSLSEKSLNVVAGLDREIDAVVFLDPSSPVYGQAEELLGRYEAASSSFKKRVVDPAKNLLEARQLVERYNIERNNVILLTSGDDRRVIDETDLVEYDYSGAQLGQAPTIKEFKGEQLITSAVLELVEAEKPKILFTTGHGEGALDAPSDPRSLAQAKDLLGKDNFELEEWDSASAIEVPADTDLVVIAGPTTNFFAPELDVLSRYLEQGGRLLVLVEPVLDGSELGGGDTLTTWLAGYGVEVGNNVVIDPTTQLPFFGPETVYTDSYGFHPIVDDLDQTRSRVLFTLARSVRKADDAPGEYEIAELVKTSSSAWGETDLTDVENLQADEGEIEGPVALGVAVSFKVAGEEEDAGDEPLEDETALFEPGGETETEDDDAEAPAPEARLAVFGDLDFASNSQLANAANGALVLNTFNWLVQREQLISIPGRKPEETRLAMSSSELGTVYLLVMLILPGIAVLTGVSVYLRRRR